MSHFFKVLMVILVFVKQEADLALTLRKFVNQKDLSEYCRRRVMPSVFLGRHVVDAYSKILQFSRLELPYSCYISVRTESGSNIILVIQLVSSRNLVESCRESKNQLLVYELGETFGGYWGALPNRVMDKSPKKDEIQYTIKTTQPATTTTTKARTRRPPTTTTSTTESDVSTNSEERPVEYFVEIPIVNVSLELAPGRLPDKSLFDNEDVFDKIVDVKPWHNETYKTKVLPLLQFSLENKDIGGALRSTVTVEPEIPKYQVQFNPDIFTTDYRLSYPVFNVPANRLQNKYKVDHKLDFKKNKKLLVEKQSLFFKTSLPMFQYPTFVSPAHDILFTSHYSTSQFLGNAEPASESWDAVNAILKNLNRSEHVSNKAKIDDVASLLQGLAKIGPNKTGTYQGLVPHVSIARHPVTSTWHSTMGYKTDSITWRQPSATYRTNYLDDEEEETGTTQVSSSTRDNRDGSTGFLLPILDVDNVVLNCVMMLKPSACEKRPLLSITQSERNEPSSLEESATSTIGQHVTSTTLATTTSSTIEKPLTLLDHKSWENMVHAASVMAVALNHSVTPREDVEPQGDYEAISKLSSSTLTRQRKKRYIHAIAINHVKPHHLPVQLDISTPTPTSDKISNAQEFQRFIELQDDEIHDRVLKRHLRHYVGPVLFNICDFNEPAARHIYMFNSSRLFLAISNFTLESMTVVITPARTLLSSDAHCPSANLECQVSGARVCIDSLSACDGVPNCGSYDIYDEDRLMCGRSAGLQHNVCLAAITFLAVLLTLLYIIHYWLKRCVPRVSEAFFIYTDAAENVLYLDPIMRSPYDTDDYSKDFYRSGGIQDYMECTDMRIKTTSVSPFIRRFLRLFQWRYKKKAASVKNEDVEIDLTQRIFSYGKLELNKLGVSPLTDTAVQTGSSLIEMHTLSTAIVTNKSLELNSEIEDVVTHYEGKKRSTKINVFELDDRVSTERISEELSILNFFKRPRSISAQLPLYRERKSSEHLTELSPQKGEEEEMQSLDFDSTIVVTGSVASINTDISEKKLEHANVQKKLRFDEEIKAVSHSDNDNVEEVHGRPRWSVMYGTEKNVHLEQLGSANRVDEPSTSTNKKGHFWGSSKSKPKKQSKKKTQLLPTLKF